MAGKYKLPPRKSRKAWNKNAGKWHKSNEPSRKAGGRRR